MSSRHAIRGSVYRNTVRLDLMLLLFALLLCGGWLLVQISSEANQRRRSDFRCERIEAEIDRARLSTQESADRIALLVERYALEDRVAAHQLNLVDSAEVTRIDLREFATAEASRTAAR